MKAVNRGVIVVKPKTPFLDWANSSDDTGAVITMDEVHQDCTAYLTSEFGDDNQLRAFLEQNYPLLFEQELFDWHQDQDAWPAKRDFHTFLEWFEVEFHSVVLDLAEGELSATVGEL